MEMVKMDGFGRILIPMRIRKKLQADTFTLEERESEVVMRPVPTLEQLVGSLPDIDMDAYWRDKKADREKERKEDEEWARRLSTRHAGSRFSKGKPQRR